MKNEPRAAWLGSGTIKWTEWTWAQNPVPRHIIKALAERPMIEMSPVVMAQGRAIRMEARGRVLE